MPRPGPQNGRFASEPLGGLTLADRRRARTLEANASVALAERLGDTVARITGDEPAPRTALARGAEAAAHRRRPRRATTVPAVARAPPRRASRGRAERAADDLKLIKGVGPELEAMLHRLGVFHFDQIADWTPEEVAWVDGNLEELRGRVSREGWVEQARELAEEGETPHAHDKIERDGPNDAAQGGEGDG